MQKLKHSVFITICFCCLQSQASCALRAVACGFDLISSLGAYTPEVKFSFSYQKKEVDVEKTNRQEMVVKFLVSDTL